MVDNLLTIWHKEKASHRIVFKNPVQTPKLLKRKFFLTRPVTAETSDFKDSPAPVLNYNRKTKINKNQWLIGCRRADLLKDRVLDGGTQEVMIMRHCCQ